MLSYGVTCLRDSSMSVKDWNIVRQMHCFFIYISE